MSESTFCRTCGRSGLSCSVPLFYRSEVTNKTVQHMMGYGIGLKVSKDDGYPQQVCRMCYGQLLVSYELKRTSLEAQSCFLQLFPPPATAIADEELILGDISMNSEQIPQTTVKLEPDDDVSSSSMNQDQFTFIRNEEIVETATSDTNDVKCMTEIGCPGNEEATSFDDLASFLPHTKTTVYGVEEGGSKHEDSTTVLGSETADNSDLSIELVKIEPEGVQFTVVQNLPKLDEGCSKTQDAKPRKRCSIRRLKKEPYTCTSCPFSTYIRSEYSLHCKIHPRLLRCICGYTTDRHFCFQRHQTNMRCKKDDDLPLMNERHDRVRKIYKNRKNHSQTHDMPVQCVCGLTTARKFNLERHLAKFRCEEVYGGKVIWPSPAEYMNRTKKKNVPEDVTTDSAPAIIENDICSETETV